MLMRRKWAVSERQIAALERKLSEAQKENRRLQSRLAAFESGAADETTVVGEKFVLVKDCLHVAVDTCEDVRLTQSIGEARANIFTGGRDNRIDGVAPAEFGVWTKAHDGSH